MRMQVVRVLASVAALGALSGIASASYDGKAQFLGQPLGDIGGGGPFLFKASNGLENKIRGLDSQNRWITFCVEENEFISYPTIYDAKISDRAIGGGRGTQTPGHGLSDRYACAPSRNPGDTDDPLDSRTAFLYSKFKNGTLAAVAAAYGHAGGFSYSSLTDGHALQDAIWFLENEIGAVDSTAGSLEKALIDAADDAVYGSHPTWFGLGNVRELNLYNGGYGDINQSQLVIIPLPAETAMAGLGFLGLVSVRGLRRRRD